MRLTNQEQSKVGFHKETVYNSKTENKIIRRLFFKSEVSWGISDFSKAIGPIIDLFFVSRFIGIDGVTVLGYMSPLIMFFELLGSRSG